MTGWDKLRDDPDRYLTDLHFPGLSTDAGRLLVDRKVAGIGIDTLGIDPGCEPDCPVHQITLPAGLWHLEGLSTSTSCRPTGAWIVAGAARIAGRLGRSREGDRPRPVARTDTSPGPVAAHAGGSV